MIELIKNIIALNSRNVCYSKCGGPLIKMTNQQNMLTMATHTHRPFRNKSLFCAEMGTENDQKSYSTLCWARFHSLCISFDHCCYMSQNVNNVSSPNAGETKHLDRRYNVNSYVMQNDCEKDLEWQRVGRKARIVIKWILYTNWFEASCTRTQKGSICVLFRIYLWWNWFLSCWNLLIQMKSV